MNIDRMRDSPHPRGVCVLLHAFERKDLGVRLTANIEKDQKCKIEKPNNRHHKAPRGFKLLLPHLSQYDIPLGVRLRVIAIKAIASIKAPDLRHRARGNGTKRHRT
jgi:hypothetical protein